ncbi:hypothetical protein ACWC5C_41415 [Streptomyces sp. NPDC001700]
MEGTSSRGMWGPVFSDLLTTIPSAARRNEVAGSRTGGVAGYT